MKKRIISILVLILMLGGIFTTASAQTYRFSVPKTDVLLAINADGTATLEYFITFSNDPGADPIDYVDIGMPNSSYRLSNIVADVDGVEIKEIVNSPYVTPGVALGLGDNAIQPGQTGTVHMVAYNIEDMLFPGTGEEKEPYASFQFMPNYFDSSFAKGKTDLKVTFFFPPNMTEDEPRWYPPQGWPGESEPFSGKEDNGLMYYEWNSPDADSHSQYTFGAAFPARLVPEKVIVTEPTPDYSGGSGTTGGGSFSNFFENFCCFGSIIGFIGVMIWGSIAANKAAKKAKMAYLPPKIAIEGHGVKRGLTAVEAAILMETPMEKVMTMMLFSCIKKNAATVISKEPLKLELTDPLPAELQDYEKEFLQAFMIADQRTRTKELQAMMVNLVKSVTQKMKGFSLKETKEYYQDIIRRAWEQVETAETPEVKMQRFDDYMGWTMLDKEFDDRTQRTFGAGPVFVPIWWGRYDPGYGSTISPSTSGGGQVAAPVSSAGKPSGGTVSMPTLPGSAFAGSIVGSIQGFASGVVGDIQGFTSGITRITNPPPPPSTYRSGGGRSGGSSCACACACAGCACACAGGGR